MIVVLGTTVLAVGVVVMKFVGVFDSGCCDGGGGFGVGGYGNGGGGATVVVLALPDQPSLP